MSALIGSTGFVGGHLQRKFDFLHKFNRSNISDIQHLNTDFLVCAGLPAEKWRANSDPETDWSNMADLAEKISSVKASRAVLISTIDVYQPAIDVTEIDKPNYNGVDAYGRNRAWFEMFFLANFEEANIIRLPGLFAQDLRKNLIFDLINNRKEQLMSVNPRSRYQFFNLEQLGNILDFSIESDIKILNVATEPVYANEIAEIFEQEFFGETLPVSYNMKTNFSAQFGGSNDYLFSKANIINDIYELRKEICK